MEVRARAARQASLSVGQPDSLYIERKQFHDRGVRLHVLPIASAQLMLVLPLTVAMAVLDAGASWLARRRHRAPAVPPVSSRWLAQHEVEAAKRGDDTLDR